MTVEFAPLGDDGTELTVTHGRYTLAPADQEERQGHLEGWVAFLGKLRQVVATYGQESGADATPPGA